MMSVSAIIIYIRIYTVYIYIINIYVYNIINIIIIYCIVLLVYNFDSYLFNRVSLFAVHSQCIVWYIAPWSSEAKLFCTIYMCICVAWWCRGSWHVCLDFLQVLWFPSSSQNMPVCGLSTELSLGVKLCVFISCPQFPG